MNYQKLFGVQYAVTDYEEASDHIITKALAKEHLAVSALAVHGLMEAHNDQELQKQINRIDLVVPDGQPIRWALNYFYKAGLKDRVYGPSLTIHVLEKAEKKQVSVFFYGSKPETLVLIEKKLRLRYPNLKIAGMQADRFREASPEEMQQDIEAIKASGAQLVFVGRGCPRQERWVATHRDHLAMPLLAVGAAFDFIAGNFSQAPTWMQRNGLEWLYRLILEPRRLWKRYLFTNSLFLRLVFRQLIYNRKDH